MAMSPVSAQQGTPAPIPAEENVPAQPAAPAAGTTAIPSTSGKDASAEIAQRSAQNKIEAGTKQISTGETTKTASMSVMAAATPFLASFPYGTIIAGAVIIGAAIAYGVGCDQAAKGHKKLADGQNGMAGADAATGTVGNGAKAALEASQRAKAQQAAATAAAPAKAKSSGNAMGNFANTSTAAPTAATPQVATTAS